ncbi:acetate kinase [Calothrix sp. NIES-4071]|nr:acetate kinase [Calothrix sp. NIES-4071]BAZ57326.1 acetate kinase [Calothrix sp. NIES-4105]
MNVLVLNAGSNSLKFEVIAVESNITTPDQGKKLVSGIIEGIGGDAVLAQLSGKEVIHKQQITAQDYKDATERALEWLNSGQAPGVSSLDNIDIVGHRVVHGADKFSASVLIDEEVIAQIEELEELAPLHNKPAVNVMRAARDKFDLSINQIAVFDTVFHRNIPEYAQLYAIPPELSERYKIRRYGFHGISHQYMMMRYAKITNRPYEEIKIITLHLESGCSATAISGGKSVDTSMGFTPLEGLVMGKRCGDIDPAIVGYLARKEQTDIGEIENWLNKKSGLLGLSGLSHDTRVLMKEFDNNERVRLAIDVFCYRIQKYIGAYLSVLGGAEAIVFGGGIGENTLKVREKVCKAFEWCGLKLDSERNEQTIDIEGCISTQDSSLGAYVIPVEEGLMIALEATRTKT